MATLKSKTVLALDSPQDFKNIIQGATLFSSGGGGSKNLALKFLDQSGITNPGVTIELYKVGELPDDCLLAFVAELFAPDKMLDHPDFTCGENAYYDLMNLEGKNLTPTNQGVLFGEIGAVNVAVPMIIAYKQNKFIIDAASVGRSVAELNMTVFASDNVPMGTLVVAARGTLTDHFYQTDLPDTPEDAETFINQTMATYEKEYEDVAGFCLYKMNGQELKRIPNLPQYGITQSKTIGEVMFNAQSPLDAYQTLIPPKGQTTGQSLSNIISKKVFNLFEGTVSDIQTTSGDQSDGMVTYTNDKNVNESYTIYYENENVLAKYEVKDKNQTIRKYSVIAPDAICYMLQDAFWYDGLGYSNSETETDRAFFKAHTTTVVGIPYPDMRTAYLESAFKGGIQKVLKSIWDNLHRDPNVVCPDHYISIEALNRIPKPNIDIIPNGWTGEAVNVGCRKYLIQIDCGGISNISIRYTMDGTLPTLSSPEYTEPIHYWAEMGGTIRVIAWDLTQDNTGEYKYFSQESVASLPCSPW